MRNSCWVFLRYLVPVSLVLFPAWAFAEKLPLKNSLEFQAGEVKRFAHPSWMVRVHAGGGFFNDTGPSYPFGLQVGPFWPKLGFGVDVVGDAVPAQFEIGVAKKCVGDDDDCVASVELKFLSGRIGLSPHYGGQVGGAWLYGRVPVLISLHPLMVDGERKVSAYLNLGAGFGTLFRFAKSGIIGFEIVGYIGPALTPVLIKQVQGPIRWGGEGRFQIGWRF